MNQNFDVFNRQEKPSIVLCNPNKSQLISLDGICYDTQITLRYNAVSEVSFSYPESIDNEKTILPAYALLKNKRLILIEDVGYFQITKCEENFNGAVPIKKITANALEVELISKRLSVFAGTYAFYDVTDVENSLMGKILAMIPSWSIGTIDTSLAIKYRTFNVSDTTVYGFLMNDVAKAYGCVFEFDTINKEISASLIENSTTATGIYLSFDNLIKEGSFSEITEELTTCLFCYGADPLDIRSVNPLGTATIYNFDYFKSTGWMSDGLVTAINAWQTKIDSLQPTYATLLSTLKNLNIDLVTLNGELALLNGDYLALEGVQKARVEQGIDYAEITIQMNDKQIEIDAKKKDIFNKQSAIDTTNDQLKDIVSQLKFVNKYTQADYDALIARRTMIENQISFLSATNLAINARIFGNETRMADAIKNNQNYQAFYTQIKADKPTLRDSVVLLANANQVLVNVNAQIKEVASDLKYPGNFTIAQYTELSNFMYENTYQNENIIQTDLMTPAEIQTQSQELYDMVRGKKQANGTYSAGIMSRLSQPRYEFSVSAVNFLVLSQYKVFSDQLDLGSIITVNMGLDRDIETVVLEISFNYEDPSNFTLTFSNRLRLDNGAYRYSDLMDQLQKSASTTSFNSNAWNSWNDNYKNDVSEFITGALDAANNNIINSTDQEILINQNGLHGRKVTNPGEDELKYEKTQVWLTSSVLAFTDDNWASSQLALGKITLPGKDPTFGLVADSIFGTLVAGNKLVIQSGDNGQSFQFDENGAKINNAKFSITSPSSEILLNPTDGIKIRTNVAGTWSDKFYVDSLGNLIMSGKLVGAEGEFKGKITATSGYIGSSSGGFEINPVGFSEGIYTKDHNNYLKSSGDMKWGNLIVTGGNFSFNGTINANQIIGQINNGQIMDGAVNDRTVGSLNAGKITAGTLSGRKIEWDGCYFDSYFPGAAKFQGEGIDFIGNGGGFRVNFEPSRIYMQASTIDMSGNVSAHGDFSGSFSLSSANALSVDSGSLYNSAVYVDGYYGRRQLNFTHGLCTSVSTFTP